MIAAIGPILWSPTTLAGDNAQEAALPEYTRVAHTALEGRCKLERATPDPIPFANSNVSSVEECAEACERRRTWPTVGGRKLISVPISTSWKRPTIPVSHPGTCNAFLSDGRTCILLHGGGCISAVKITRFCGVAPYPLAPPRFTLLTASATPHHTTIPSQHRQQRVVCLQPCPLASCSIVRSRSTPNKQ